MGQRPRVLVTGSIGKVGSVMMRLLAAETSLKVIAGVRSPARIAGLGVSAVHLDYDDRHTLRPALDGIDRVSTHLRPEIFMQSVLGYGGVRTVDQMDCDDVAALAAGADPSYMRSIYENYAAYTAATNADEERVFDSVSKVTGRSPILWDAFIQTHRNDFIYDPRPALNAERS